MIHLIGTIGLIVGAVAATLFCGLYHLSARWWRSEEGWHLMTFTGALAAALDYVAIRTLLVTARPMSLGVGITRAAIFCSIGGLLVWRVWMLWRKQIRPGLKRERSRQ